MGSSHEKSAIISGEQAIIREYVLLCDGGSRGVWMPVRCRPLTVTSRYKNTISLWMLVQPSDCTWHRIHVKKAGQPLGEALPTRYVGSAKVEDGTTWHVFYGGLDKEPRN